MLPRSVRCKICWWSWVRWTTSSARSPRLVDEAVVALRDAPITVDAKQALEELATFVAWRES